MAHIELTTYQLYLISAGRGVKWHKRAKAQVPECQLET